MATLCATDREFWGRTLPLTIMYQGADTTVENDTTALIGSDAASTVRIVRPGISRKHAVVSFDGSAWKVEDAGSRNGIFADGQRIQTIEISGATTLYLGHPTDGEVISFVPVSEGDPTSTASIQDEIDEFVIPTETAAATTSRRDRTSATKVQQTSAGSASDAELAALTAALRDQISSVKGLTWSVWAMIAVTAVLSVMTLFVGILGN